MDDAEGILHMRVVGRRGAGDDEVQDTAMDRFFRGIRRNSPAATDNRPDEYAGRYLRKRHNFLPLWFIRVLIQSKPS